MAAKSAEVVVVRSRSQDGGWRARPILAGSGQTFRDCKEPVACPEMVVIPSSDGLVRLGTIDPNEPGYHLRKVLRTTLETFAVGKYAVSVLEYSQCVEAGSCRQPEWLEDGSSFHIETGSNDVYRAIGDSLSAAQSPITGVSWDDAVSYAKWLSETTGQDYRLPSDAEWEYAARAGSLGAFWWGDKPRPGGKTMAACKGCGSEFDDKALAPVGAFLANAWGVHNVHGNVWEWVADFYCESFRTSPSRGRARSEDDCAMGATPGLHVLRGGSSFHEPQFMRSSKRLRAKASTRTFSVGFRVARTLVPSVPPKSGSGKE